MPPRTLVTDRPAPAPRHEPAPRPPPAPTAAHPHRYSAAGAGCIYCGERGSAAGQPCVQAARVEGDWVRRFGRQPYDPVQHLRASVGTISTHDGEIWRVEHTTVNRLGATHERFAVFRGRVEILAHESVVMELAARAAVAQLWALRSNVGLGGGARRSAQA